jgi:hypothetical protein
MGSPGQTVLRHARPQYCSKSVLPLNVKKYYKIVVISEIFLIILEIQNIELGRRILINV